MTARSMIGVAAALGAVALTGVVLVSGSGESDDGQLVGVFADASPLEPGSDVRLDGVRIGTVDDIALKDGKAHVSVDTDIDMLPLHEDASMTLRPVNLLGEYYIDVDAGTDSKPMLEGGTVAVEHTKTVVSLQEVIDTLDDPTSTALAAMLTGLGEGMKDSGAEAAQAIKALAPAMRDATQLGDVLSGQNDVLTQLVDRVRPVAQALAAGNGDVLDRVVASTERMLSALAAENAAVEATLMELPGTVAAARRTLNEISGVSAETTPTLRVLRPVTDDLEEITGELLKFADAADPALASLKPVLERADALLNQAAPVVARLRTAGPDVRGVAKGLRPLGDQLLDQHLGDLMAFVKKWSLSTNGKDALSHYFRGVVHVTPNTLADLTSSPLAPPPSGGDAKSPLNLLSNLGVPNLLSGLGGLLPGGNQDQDPRNATGLTQQQEQSLLNQLLGGL